MAVEVIKVFTTTCRGALLDAINADGNIAPNLEQIIEDGAGNSSFWFASALSGAEDTHLDGVLSGWSCPAFITSPPEDMMMSGSPTVGQHVHWDGNNWVPVDAPTGGGIYGSEFHYAESNTVTTINNENFVTKVSLTTASLPAGTYQIDFSYSWNLNSTQRDIEVQFCLDSSPMGYDHRQEPQDSGGSFGSTGSDQKHLAFKRYFRSLNGVHTIELDFRTTDDDVAASMWDANITLIRVQ